MRLALSDEERRKDGKVLYRETIKTLGDMDTVFFTLDGTSISGTTAYV